MINPSQPSHREHPLATYGKHIIRRREYDRHSVDANGNVFTQRREKLLHATKGWRDRRLGPPVQVKPKRKRAS